MANTEPLFSLFDMLATKERKLLETQVPPRWYRELYFNWYELMEPDTGWIFASMVMSIPWILCVFWGKSFHSNHVTWWLGAGLVAATILSFVAERLRERMFEPHSSVRFFLSVAAPPLALVYFLPYLLFLYPWHGRLEEATSIRVTMGMVQDTNPNSLVAHYLERLLGEKVTLPHHRVNETFVKLCRQMDQLRKSRTGAIDAVKHGDTSPQTQTFIAAYDKQISDLEPDLTAWTHRYRLMHNAKYSTERACKALIDLIYQRSHTGQPVDFASGSSLFGPSLVDYQPTFAARQAVIESELKSLLDRMDAFAALKDATPPPPEPKPAAEAKAPPPSKDLN